MNDKRIKYPSVSEIYGVYSRRLFAGMSTDEIINNTLLNNKVKSHCLSSAKNEWRMEIEDECKAYIKSFDLWKNAHLDELLYADLVLYDDVKRFTGTVPFIGKRKGDNRISLFLVKTGYPAKYWDIQIAAYRHLCQSNGINVEHSFILRLSNQGKEPNVIEQNDITPYVQIFESCLTTWQYFKGNYDVDTQE